MDEALVGLLTMRLKARGQVVGTAEAMREIREAVDAAEHACGRQRGERVQAGDIAMGELSPIRGL